MHKHRHVTLRRFEIFRDELVPKVYPEKHKVKLSAFAAPGRISYDEAMQGEYKAIDLGHHFLPEWSTHWVRFEFEYPQDWDGREVHLLWDTMSEACVWKDWEIVQAISPGHRKDCCLTNSAKGGSSETVYLEVACNHLFGMADEARFSPVGFLRQAEVAVYDSKAWDLLWDFMVIQEMARELPKDSPRAGQAMRVANDIVNAAYVEDSATWKKGRELAAEFLKQSNSETQHTISAIGHAHLDTAWLWPLAETMRKAYRSFSTQLRYMDEYPDYVFACSQACQWEWMKEQQPAVYEKMLAKAKEGRFLPTGGTWVEPDCNIPSGESLVRQFLYGQRYFEQETGHTCGVFWNPDVFGYCGQMPQIMRGAEVGCFLTQKLSWNQFNKMPHHTFHWEGIDGSKVLTHFPPVDTYNADAKVKQVVFNVKNYKDHTKSNNSYYLFGFGDGGSGPTREMLERIERMKDVDGLPKVRYDSSEKFFERLENNSQDLLTWVGELYFELHRGTYTTQANNKKFNRQGEFLLGDVECLFAVLDRANYPQDELDRLWKLLLLNQFHDIIPGSSITPVYEDSDRDYEDILSSGAKLRDAVVANAAGESGDNVMAINTLSKAREEVVDLPDGSTAIVSAPACGLKVQAPAKESNLAVIAKELADGGVVLENDFVAAVINSSGRLVSLFDKHANRETVLSGAEGNKFILYDDKPTNWEAWDIDIYHFEKIIDEPVASSVKVVEAGPLRASVEIEIALSDKSTLKQTVSLTALSARLDFACDVDWNESKTLLKVEFPWELRSPRATYEIQFGHLERPTHSNTSWDMAQFEVCAHRWADLSEPDFGVALMNNCKYGYNTIGNVMQISLLRAPKSPDPTADIGKHSFSFAAFPHQGSFQDAGVIDEALRFNSPMLLANTAKADEEQSWFRVDRDNVQIDSVKKAEDSDEIVLRLFESHGKRGPVCLTSTLPVKSAVQCNLLERQDEAIEWTGGGVDLYFEPFKILTVKLKSS